MGLGSGKQLVNVLLLLKSVQIEHSEDLTLQGVRLGWDGGWGGGGQGESIKNTFKFESLGQLGLEGSQGQGHGSFPG